MEIIETSRAWTGTGMWLRSQSRRPELNHRLQSTQVEAKTGAVLVQRKTRESNLIHLFVTDYTPELDELLVQLG